MICGVCGFCGGVNMTVGGLVGVHTKHGSTWPGLSPGVPDEGCLIWVGGAGFEGVLGLLG